MVRPSVAGAKLSSEDISGGRCGIAKGYVGCDEKDLDVGVGTPATSASPSVNCLLDGMSGSILAFLTEAGLKKLSIDLLGIFCSKARTFGLLLVFRLMTLQRNCRCLSFFLLKLHNTRMLSLYSTA